MKQNHKKSLKDNSFPYNLDFSNINVRLTPDLYKIGRGEQGVLLVEPYKSEILPHWRFRTPVIAEKSSRNIYTLFLKYKKLNDFIGMDMARKFMQMGYTRARRYANHGSGRKYVSNPQLQSKHTQELAARKKIRPQDPDWKTNEKAQSAQIFYEQYLKIKNDPTYIDLKSRWLKK